jgi:hypothetical protein
VRVSPRASLSQIVSGEVLYLGGDCLARDRDAVDRHRQNGNVLAWLPSASKIQIGVSRPTKCPAKITRMPIIAEIDKDLIKASDTKSSDQRWFFDCGSHHRHPRSQGPLAPAAVANRQPFVPVDPEQLLVVHSAAFTLQQQVQTAVAEPAAVSRQRAKARAKRTIITSARPAGQLRHP